MQKERPVYLRRCLRGPGGGQCRKVAQGKERAGQTCGLLGLFRKYAEVHVLTCALGSLKLRS